MPRFRIRFPTTSTVDIIRKAKATIPPQDRAHTGRRDCLCWPCEKTARHAEDDALDRAQGLEDELRYEEEGR